MPVYEKDGAKFYMPPKDENGKHYWVPVVVKNRDYLIAFTDGMWTGLAIAGEEDDTIRYSPSMFLSSDRLVDFTDDGRRLSSMTPIELGKYVAEKLERANYANEHNQDHPDNDCDFSEYFFTAACSCGNFIAYTDQRDIPEHDIICDMCNRTIVEYIHEEDENILYEGINQDQYELFVTKMRIEMFGEDQNDFENSEDD